jgi:hypothetical protein
MWLLLFLWIRLLLQGCIEGSGGFEECISGNYMCWFPKMFWTAVAMLVEAHTCWKTVFWKQLHLRAFSGLECFETCLFTLFYGHQTLK